MKKMFIFIALALCLICAGLAFAATQGRLVLDPNNKELQTPSPYPPASACTTTTTTKGTLATVSVAGYSQLCWEASDSNYAAKRIRRHLGSNTAYLPGTGGCLGLNSDMSTVVFKPISSTSAAYTVCTELTRGGKTP